ncbi:hypothetical protein HA149_07025 [Prochlorococcus marinus XMU1406]|uniref:hypothetical protein n=1 Tax=Prochlorococcus marinus TaxID=1219 RepID=UPI001ADBA516|nr:hypothetical protein [Prochlorococcus marinus]MBO8206809.1 hypothetical protein [Prochlorococcus marinus XMU1406]MCR8542628.1 hypothetical protein [Prochlorococcus marinus XMU1427]
MKISKLLFVLTLITFLSFFLAALFAYDVFYNDAISTFFGGDSVNYLNLKYEIQTFEDVYLGYLESGLGSLFGTYGITFISLFLNDFFGGWALYGSILFNLIIVYFSYYILDKSYNYQLQRFKSNALILNYIFPSILIYLIGPNKEIFTFLASCILVRLSFLKSLSKSALKNRNEIIIYLLILIFSVFIRDIYLAISLFAIVFLLFNKDVIRYSILYLSTIIFYFIRPEFYTGSDRLLNQDSQVITLLLEKYFDQPFTFVIQIFGRVFVAIFGILYPSRILGLFDGSNLFAFIRLIFVILISFIFFNLFNIKDFKISKFPYSPLTKNLLFCLIMVLMLFGLGNYNSDRKIIPTFPICFALICSLKNDKTNTLVNDFKKKTFKQID